MDESKVKCSRCHCWRDRMEYLKKNIVLKSCVSCRQNDIKQREKQKCKHGRPKGNCIECGGGSMCEHGKLKYRCVDCGGSSICEHGRRKDSCVDCGGSQICEHNRRKNRCVQCGGVSICKHHIRKDNCQICNLNLYLINKQRQHIKRCFQYTSLKKTKSSIEYLGCDIDTFIRHMEKKLMDDMTWDNIHIDHIKPVSRFNLDIEEEFNKCCHYTNLQPLLAKDNMNKHNKWTDENEVYWNENIIYKDYDKIYL